jgi:hypothetical protein
MKLSRRGGNTCDAEYSGTLAQPNAPLSLDDLEKAVSGPSLYAVPGAVVRFRVHCFKRVRNREMHWKQ